MGRCHFFSDSNANFDFDSDSCHIKFPHLACDQDCGVGIFKIRLRLPNMGNSIMQNTICLKLGWQYFLKSRIGTSVNKRNSFLITICLEFLDFCPRVMFLEKKLDTSSRSRIKYCNYDSLYS